MNVERSSLVERAQIHSALGDPARLAIVDALIAGDVAPGELGERLGMPTNLIAHHLKVLQDAGVVARARSEGDRRRTYVRLVPESLTTITAPVLSARRVVFVCTQNSARSQLAAAVWARRSHVPAFSAGTDPATRVHPGAVRVARKHGLNADGWRTAHVDQVLLPDDLVIAVCDNAYEHLHPDPDVSPAMPPRLHWSVPDPAPVGTDAAFETAYRDLTIRVDRLVPVLADQSGDTTRSRS